MNNQAFIEEKYEDVTQKTAKKFDIFPHKGNTSIAKKKKQSGMCYLSENFK